MIAAAVVTAAPTLTFARWRAVEADDESVAGHRRGHRVTAAHASSPSRAVTRVATQAGVPKASRMKTDSTRPPLEP